MRHPNNKKGSRHRSDDHYAGSSEVPSHDAQSVGTPVEDEGSNTMIQSSTAFTNELEKGDVSEQQALDTRLLRTPTQASRDQTDASTTHTDISSWREEPRPGVAWLQGVTYTQFLTRLQTVSGRDQILSLVQFGSLALHGSLQCGIAGGNCGQSLLKLSNMVANYRAQTRLWALLSVLSIPTLHEVFGGPEALLQHLLHSIRAIGSLVLLGPEWIVHWVLGRRPWGALSSMKNTDATAHSVVATTSRESAAIPLSELTARWVRIFQWFLELVFLRFENVGLLASVGVLQRPSPRAVQISLVAIAAWLVNLCVSLLVQFRDCVRPLTGKGEKKDRRRLQIHLLRTVCLWFVAQYALTPIRRGEVALHVFDEATLQVSDWKRCMNRSVQRGILTLLRMGWDVSSTCAGCMGTVATLCDFIAN